jgi:hypothetical protein
MRKYIESGIKDVEGEINKTFKSIWEFTYKIVCADENGLGL